MLSCVLFLLYIYTEDEEYEGTDDTRNERVSRFTQDMVAAHQYHEQATTEQPQPRHYSLGQQALYPEQPQSRHYSLGLIMS